MSNLYISSTGILCKPFYDKGVNQCERGIELGVSYVLGIGGFKDESSRYPEFRGYTIVFIDEFLIKKP